MRNPTFPVAKRGYEPNAVDAAVEDLRDRVMHAEATTLAARTYAASLLSELQRLQALEDELTTALELARQTGAAIVAEAQEQAAGILASTDHEAGARLAVAELEARNRTTAAQDEAARTLAEGRARLAAETAEMERYRLAIAAEAMMLQQVEQRLGPRLSRAAARLVEVVDAPDGIGPFSRTTSTLVEFCRLLQRSVDGGTFDDLELEVQGGEAVLRLRSRAIDLRDGEPMVPTARDRTIDVSDPARPTVIAGSTPVPSPDDVPVASGSAAGTAAASAPAASAPAGPTVVAPAAPAPAPATPQPPAPDRPAQAKVANISSMALS